jgi:hypothetical protein
MKCFFSLNVCVCVWEQKTEKTGKKITEKTESW